MTSASAKDLAALVSAALRDIVTGEPLVGDARVDMTASDLRPVAALLTRYAEVEGGLETTEEERMARLAAAEWGVKSRIGSAEDLFIAMILRDITRLTAQVAALKEERDAAEEIVSEAINELHCCDDIPLQTGLVEGIEALRKDRDALNADRYAIGCNRDNWRERALATEAERDAANARIAELETCIQHPWFQHPPSPEEAAEAWADWVEGVRANLPEGARLVYESSANVVVENFLTEPEAKGGDPAPVPATTEKTDD